MQKTLKHPKLIMHNYIRKIIQTKLALDRVSEVARDNFISVFIFNYI